MAKKYWERHKVRGIELKAMRMMRGKTIEEVGYMIGVSSRLLEHIENHFEEVPKHIAEAYMTKLGITNSHMKQFKLILQGQLKTFSETREISPVVKKAVRKKCKNKCVRCGATKKLHFHHIVRFSEGGQNTVDNLILLCASCHAEEHKGERAYHMLKKMSKGDGIGGSNQKGCI